jgi:hypothetical protein
VREEILAQKIAERTEPDYAAFESEVLGGIQATAERYLVPVTVDVDARGSKTRISVSVQEKGEPGILRIRQYD